MKHLLNALKQRSSKSVSWLAIAAAVLITVAATAAMPGTASASNLDPPNLIGAFCLSGGNSIAWSTGNNGLIEAPEGWKVERTHRDSQGTSFVQTFTFIGTEADDLLTSSRDRWFWGDISAERNLPYTYRVRAINADGTEVEGRTWSRSVAVDCFSDVLAQPGISLSECECDGFAMLWRTGNNGQDQAPDGWKVERWHMNSERNEVVHTFTFIGAEAQALLTSEGRYWRWVDNSADRNLDYIYRVRAINMDGSDTEGRIWSRSVSPIFLVDPLVQPSISVPQCQDGGVLISWLDSNRVEDVALRGWKVERRHWNSDHWVIQTFNFVSTEAAALPISENLYTKWVDNSVDRNRDYAYRVRAINSDGSYTEGRTWSRSAVSTCLEYPLAEPGISVPQCKSGGVSISWHTRNRGEGVAPQGWKVERRHWDADGWIVQTFTFMGAQADALQTPGEEYWDWMDTTADPGVAYTYRVRAINSDGSNLFGRTWSRRAALECGPSDA